MPTIVVHGGAGEDAAEERAGRRDGLERAAAAGAVVLARGGDALDAVVDAVALLEDDPLFNAGLGSVLTEDGDVEMDASVMEGERLRAGAVAAVSAVANAVRAALAVLAEDREVLLVGDPVQALARRHGLRVVPGAALVTAAARARWERRQAARGNTVGAVAVDARGHVAAATSTGGVAGKRRGRVGDSAIIGAGTYADDRTGAVSATGPGEAIIRVSLAHVALDLIRAGEPPPAAATRALAWLHERTGAAAGLIVLTPDGVPGVAFTTPAMPSAVRHVP